MTDSLVMLFSRLISSIFCFCHLKKIIHVIYDVVLWQVSWALCWGLVPACQAGEVAGEVQEEGEDPTRSRRTRSWTTPSKRSHLPNPGGGGGWHSAYPFLRVAFDSTYIFTSICLNFYWKSNGFHMFFWTASKSKKFQFWLFR